MTKPQHAETFIRFGDLSRITRTPEPTLAQRIDRGIFKLSRRDKLSSGSGTYREFSRITTIKFTIAQKFVELNIGAGPAHEAASLFTDQSQPGRAAGECFEHGKTVLLITPDGATVRNLDFSANIFDMLNDGVLIAIDLNKVVADVDAVLISYN
jgi:hypothetical protein